jgi:hypothetical protein
MGGSRKRKFLYQVENFLRLTQNPICKITFDLQLHTIKVLHSKKKKKTTRATAEQNGEIFASLIRKGFRIKRAPTNQ